MRRYIDVDALAYLVVNNGDADFINKVTKLMIEAPSIDIVRCAECERWNKGRVDFSNCELMGIVRADDFCSYGERRKP